MDRRVVKLEDRELALLTNSDLTNAEIAKTLERSMSWVTTKRRKLDVNYNKVARWTDKEVNLLRDLYNRDYSLKEMSEIFNRTTSSVAQKIMLLGLKEEYFFEVLLPVEKYEWEHFIGYVDKCTNCTQLLKTLGYEYTRGIFIKVLDAAVTEKIISKEKFNSIIKRYNLEHTAEYRRFKNIRFYKNDDIIK